MSIAVGRRIVSKFYASSAVKYVTRAISLKLNSTLAGENLSVVEEPLKVVIPDAVPGRIHAAVLKKFCGPLLIENIHPPKILQPNEVLIDVHYCALNGSDILLSENLYGFQPSLPMILGYELVGELVQIGEQAEKTGYKPGDKVIALNKERHGGFAEQCIAEVGDIWKVPSSVKLMDAVCMLDNYATALIGLDRRAAIEEDDMILINVGLGGVGLAAVDIATNVFRAKVIGVCATEDRTTLVRDKGAFASLKYNDKKLMKQIASIAAERDIKAIFDGVSGENFKKVLQCFTDVYKSELTTKDMLRDSDFAVVVQHLSREGRVIVAGIATTNIEPNLHKDSFTVTGTNLLEYRKRDHDLYRQIGDEVLEFFEEGLITPTYSLITGLYKINDALRYVSEMKSSGKVIIDFKNKKVAFYDVEKYKQFLSKK